MTVEVTSLMAYHDAESQAMFKSVREYIYYIVENAQHPSSSDIARIGGISRTTVTGRLRELEEDGRIRKVTTKIDPFTKKAVYWYAVTGE